MFARLIAALSFLTIVPAGRWFNVSRADVAASVGFFPLVGALLGAAICGATLGLSGHVSPLLAAALAVSLWAVTTGALHLDGVADFFDAMAGAKGDRQRALEILRDPHTGAAGVVAVVLLLVIKIAAVAELIAGQDFRLLFLCPVAARFAVVLIILVSRPARPAGLAASLGAVAKPSAALLSVPTLAVALILAGTSGVVPLLAALAVSFAVRAYANHLLGGVTGDVYGTVIETAETTFLVLSLY